eukprot:scaffold32821_cov112-Isochrysis_galbana.AAC.5
MDEFEELEPEVLNKHRRRRRCTLTILPHPSSQGTNYVQVVLHVTLEPTYPVLLPLIRVENAAAAAHKLGDPVLSELRGLLALVSREHAGSVHLMALAEAAREFVCARNVPEPAPVSAHEQMLRRQKQEGGAPRLDVTVLPVNVSHQASPKQAGRGGSTDIDGFRLEELEAELDVHLQAVHRKRKQKTLRRRKARGGGGDARGGEGGGGGEVSRPSGVESSDDDELAKMTPPRSLLASGAARPDAPPPRLAPRQLIPPLAAPPAALAAPPKPKIAAHPHPKKASQASAFAEAAVDAGRKMWGSVRDLISGSGAAWSREGGRSAGEGTSTGEEGG